LQTYSGGGSFFKGVLPLVLAEHTCTDSTIRKSGYQPKDSAAGTGGIHMSSIQPMTHATCI